MPTKNGRETAAEKEARIREELRVERVEALEALKNQMLRENQVIINAIKSSHAKQLLEVRTEVYEEVERDRIANVQMQRQQIDSESETIADQDAAIESLEERVKSQSGIIQTQAKKLKELDDTIIQLKQELAEQWELISSETTHYDQVLAMLKHAQLECKSWESGDRKYIKIGSNYSHAIWNFDLQGRFIYQAQYEFEEAA